MKSRYVVVTDETFPAKDKNRKIINDKLHEKLELERKELSEKLRARREENERATALKLEKEEKVRREKRELNELKQQEALSHFLKTQAQPVLYYLPEKLTDEMTALIAKQKEETSKARNTFEQDKPGNYTNDPLPRDEDTSMTDEE